MIRVGEKCCWEPDEYKWEPTFELASNLKKGLVAEWEANTGASSKSHRERHGAKKLGTCGKGRAKKNGTD